MNIIAHIPTRVSRVCVIQCNIGAIRNCTPYDSSIVALNIRFVICGTCARINGNRIAQEQMDHRISCTIICPGVCRRTRRNRFSIGCCRIHVVNDYVFLSCFKRVSKNIHILCRYRLARACHRLERAYHKLGVVLYRIRRAAVCIGIGYFYYAIAEAARKGDYAAAANALNRSVRLCKRPYRRLIGCARRYVYGGSRERYARLLPLNNSLYGLLLLRDFFAVKVYFYAGINRFGACLDNHFLVEIELVTVI